MKHITVKTKNVTKLHGILGELEDRNASIPGLALLTGKSGAGKTTAIASAIGIFGAVYVRAYAVTTYSSLLDSIVYELGLEAKTRNAVKVQAIIDSLRDTPKPLFVDEADYLARDGRMLEILRDIHDATKVPVVLIGMEGMERKILRYPQVSRRVSQKLEFRPCDLEDAELAARELCEVEVGADLVARMHKAAKGSIGHIVIALTKFEELARDSGLARICLEQWGDRPMFLGDRAE